MFISNQRRRQQQQQHNSNLTNFIYIFQMLFSLSHSKRWHIDLVLNIIAILCTNNIINVLEPFRHGPLLIRIHCWPNKRRMSITTRFQVLKPVHVISKKLPGSIWYFLRNIVTDLKSCSVFVLFLLVFVVFFCLENTTKCKSSSRHNSHILSSRVVDKPHTYTDPMKSTRCAKVSRRKIGFVVTPFVLVRERAERKQKSKVNCD